MSSDAIDGFRNAVDREVCALFELAPGDLDGFAVLDLALAKRETAPTGRPRRPGPKAR
jgi:hypothetical protein